jgi:hypothetical protein
MCHRRVLTHTAISMALGALVAAALPTAAQVRQPGPVTVPPGGPVIPTLPDVQLVSLKVSTGPCQKTKNPLAARQFTVYVTVKNMGPGLAKRWDAWAAANFTTNDKPISPSYPKGYSGYAGSDSAIVGGPVELKAGESVSLQATASAPGNTLPVTWQFHAWLVPGSKGDRNETNNDKVFNLTTPAC